LFTALTFSSQQLALRIFTLCSTLLYQLRGASVFVHIHSKTLKPLQFWSAVSRSAATKSHLVSEWRNLCFHHYPTTCLANRLDWHLTYHLPCFWSHFSQSRRSRRLLSLERYQVEENTNSSLTIWWKDYSNLRLRFRPKFGRLSAVVCSRQRTPVNVFTHIYWTALIALTPISVST